MPGPYGWLSITIHRRGPWRSFEAAELATLEWVSWFNHRRLLEPLGNIPPTEAEANYYASTATMDKLPIRSFISTAKKQGWKIIEALTAKPQALISRLRLA